MGLTKAPFEPYCLIIFIKFFQAACLHCPHKVYYGAAKIRDNDATPEIPKGHKIDTPEIQQIHRIDTYSRTINL